MISLRHFAFATVFAATYAPAPFSRAEPPIETRRDSVVETMHEFRIEDPYRWLEAQNSAEVNAWAHVQNEAAEEFAGPGLAAREARILEYSRHLTTRRLVSTRSGDYFLRGWAGVPRQALFLGDPNGEARLIAGSPLDEAGPAENISGYWPSRDGTLVVVFATQPGSNWGQLRLIETATGSVRAVFDGAQTAVTSVAWLADGSAFVYSKYDQEGDGPVRGRVVAVQANGAEGREVFSADVAPGRSLTLGADARQRRIFVDAYEGSSGISDLYAVDLRRASQTPIRLTDGGGTWTYLGSRNNSIWAFTNAGAPNGRIVRIDGVNARPQQRTVLAESSNAVISGGSQVGGNAVAMVGDHLALLFQEDAEPSLRVFDLSGHERFRVAIPPTGTVWGGLVGDVNERNLHYGFLGAAEPSSIYRLDLRTGENTLVSAAEIGVSPADVVAERVFVQRPDGARVPVIIAHRRGLDISSPHRTYMYGYGAFGWVSFLWYQPHVIDWLMHDDGVFVVAGVRGGGEFGNAWREAGRRRNRQVAIDDYLAVAEYLNASGISRPDLLVANGGSISAGLAGAALNQRPDLFAAGVIDYGVLDLLRYDQFGHASLWRDELGSPQDPDDFAVLRAISPLHNIPARRCAPILVRVGPNDATVTPAHGYKFAAALQAAGCRGPVYLDVMEGAGHNYGSTPEEVAHSHAVALEFLDRVLPRT